MIYDFYLQTKEYGLTCNDAAARLLYAGIVGDTGRFLYPSTTKKTFVLAAELVTYRFDRSKLYDGMYSISDKLAKLKGYIYQNFNLWDGGLAFVKLTKSILEEFEIKPTETGQLVSILGDIEGIVAWVVFIEEEEQIRVRLRSKGPTINELAAKYNGGGHPLASGATVTTWEEADEVINDLQGICQAFKK